MVFGRSKSGTALIPIFGTITMYLKISTRSGNITVNKGDGSSLTTYTPSINTDATVNPITNLVWNYATAFTGDISLLFPKGLKDVYSIEIGRNKTNSTTEKYNITNLETFFNQFPNLYSVKFDENSNAISARESIIKGDLSRFPDSLERILINDMRVVNVNTDLVLNFSNFSNTSQLKYFNYSDSFFYVVVPRFKVIGNLAKFPTSGQFLYLSNVGVGSAITYTGVKVWASSFDTLSLPLPLTPTETDNLFIDANNSVTTAIGGKLWDLKGVRTPTSDVAVAGLIAKSFTVNCFRISDTMLTMPLSANLLDYSTYSNHATMVGTETHSLGGLVTSTGNYAYIPNKTSLDFGTGNLRFGCTVKFSAVTGTKGIIGKTYFGSIKGRYGITIDGGSIYGLSQMTAGNVINTVPIGTYNDGNFHTIEVICNRTTGNQTLTIDGVLINTTSFTPSSDNLALNQKFHIGAHGNTSGGIVASSELNGIIKDVFVNKF